MALADFNELVSLLDEVGPASLSADEGAGLAHPRAVLRLCVGVHTTNVAPATDTSPMKIEDVHIQRRSNVATTERN